MDSTSVVSRNQLDIDSGSFGYAVGAAGLKLSLDYAAQGRSRVLSCS